MFSTRFPKVPGKPNTYEVRTRMTQRKGEPFPRFVPVPEGEESDDDYVFHVQQEPSFGGIPTWSQTLVSSPNKPVQDSGSKDKRHHAVTDFAPVPRSMAPKSSIGWRVAERFNQMGCVGSDDDVGQLAKIVDEEIEARLPKLSKRVGDTKAFIEREIGKAVRENIVGDLDPPPDEDASPGRERIAYFGFPTNTPIGDTPPPDEDSEAMVWIENISTQPIGTFPGILLGPGEVAKVKATDHIAYLENMGFVKRRKKTVGYVKAPWKSPCECGVEAVHGPNTSPGMHSRWCPKGKAN